MLFTHQPGNVHTTKKPIRTVDDMKGMRIRFASSSCRRAAWTARSSTMAAPAWRSRWGGTVRYSNEMYSYVTSFGLAANPEWYGKLPADLRKLIDDSMKGVEKEVGEGWDALDSIGKKLLVDGGAQPIRLAKEEDAKFRAIGAQVTEAKLKELEGKGMPAREAYKLMRALSEQHARSSKNFWN